VLEISMDTKAKVSVGDYVRGGKNPRGLFLLHDWTTFVYHMGVT
jgi:hypothetical protein